MKWIIFGVVCIGILAALVITNQKTETTFNGDASKIITEGPISDRYYGNDEQKVVLIEYGDFQCPACATMFPVVKSLKEEYADSLTFIFRHLPLTNIHPNALATATAAEAAGQQGKFFDMHDKLYQNQSAWTNAGVGERGAVLEQYAQEIGLNLDQYRQDVASPDVSAKINRDQATATNFGLSSTPSFILNGQKLPESVALNAEEFTKTVREALEAASVQVDKSTDN